MSDAWKKFVKMFCKKYEGIDGDDGSKAEAFLVPMIAEYVSTTREEAKEEGVRLGINNLEKWEREWKEDKDAVGTFFDWIKKNYLSKENTP